MPFMPDTNNTNTSAPAKLSDKEVFLKSINNAYNSDDFSDYRFSTSTETDDQAPLPDTLKAEYPEFKDGGFKMLWEVRIALLPTPNNLLRAANILANIFSETGVTFKSYIMSVNTDKTLPDGTTITESIKSDRDQRGKEFCFYLKFNSSTKGFEKTPEQYKELLLNSWAKLATAGIESGYMATTRVGEATIPTAPGIETPFTLAANKPYKGRHGILNQAHHNPLQFPNPLAGITITYNDLEEHGIPLNSINHMLEQRIGYLEEHSEKSQNQWRKRFKKIADETALDMAFNLPGVIKTLRESLQAVQPFSPEIKDTIEACIDKLRQHAPLDADNGKEVAASFQVVRNVADLWAQVKTEDTCDNIPQLERLVFACEIQLTAEIKLLTAEFLKNTYCVDELQALNISVNTFEAMCATHAPGMLVLYRNARYLEDEFKGLSVERQNLITHIQQVKAKQRVNGILLQMYNYPWDFPWLAKVPTIKLSNIRDSKGKLLPTKETKITPQAYEVVQLINAARYGTGTWVAAWEKSTQDGFGLAEMKQVQLSTKISYDALTNKPANPNKNTLLDEEDNNNTDSKTAIPLRNLSKR
jgi:hypothetical protein